MSVVDRIAAGRTDLVFEHVRGGNVATARDKDGVPLIVWCAYHGDVSAMRFLVAGGETLKSLGDNFDLNAAVFHGHRQVTAFLIESGADVNRALAETGETPLHAALAKADRARYDPVLKLLIDAGADPDRATKPGVATGSFMRDCRTRGETPLHRAAAFGSELSIQLLLDAGTQIDARDMNGDSPLAWASWYAPKRDSQEAVLRPVLHTSERAVATHVRNLRRLAGAMFYHRRRSADLARLEAIAASLRREV